MQIIIVFEILIKEVRLHILFEHIIFKSFIYLLCWQSIILSISQQIKMIFNLIILLVKYTFLLVESISLFIFPSKKQKMTNASNEIAFL